MQLHDLVLIFHSSKLVSRHGTLYFVLSRTVRPVRPPSPVSVRYVPYASHHTALWKEKFKDYPGELPISTTKPTIVSNISQKKEQKPIDIAAMHKGVPPPATKYDDGSGKLQVWRVLDFDKEPVPEELYGHFWSSCSYLLKYTYMVRIYSIHYHMENRSSVQKSSLLLEIIGRQLGESAAVLLAGS